MFLRDLVPWLQYIYVVLVFDDHISCIFRIQSLETSLSEANSNNFDYDVESSNSQVVYDKGSSAGFRSNVPGGPGFGKNNRRLVSQLQQLRLLPKDYQLVSVGGLLGKVLCVADFIDYHWVFYSLRYIYIWFLFSWCCSMFSKLLFSCL